MEVPVNKQVSPVCLGLYVANRDSISAGSGILRQEDSLLGGCTTSLVWPFS